MADKGKGKEKERFPAKSVRFDMNLGGDKNKARAAMSFKSEMGRNDSPMSGMDDQSSETSGMGGNIYRGLGGPDYRHKGSSNKGGNDERGMGRMDPKDAKIYYQMGLEGANATQAKQPSTKHSRDIVEQRYRKTLTKDPQSYSLTTTTVPQQAEAESNFVGSAYFFNMTMPQVQRSLAGEYLIVYARPKISRTYPRGSVVETFDPDFKNRITIFTEVPRKGIVDASMHQRIASVLAPQNGVKDKWCVGTLLFNGARIALCFDHPEPRTKSYSHVWAETFPEEPTGTTLLDKVLHMGPVELGSKVRFGIKDMIYEHGVQYGFEFIDLNLQVYNQITGEKDHHIIVGVKMPEKMNVSSTFILKQQIDMPPLSWYRWQRHITSETNKLKNLVSNVSNVVSDWYESETAIPEGVTEEEYRKFLGLS